MKKITLVTLPSLTVIYYYFGHQNQGRPVGTGTERDEQSN